MNIGKKVGINPVAEFAVAASVIWVLYAMVTQNTARQSFLCANLIIYDYIG